MQPAGEASRPTGTYQARYLPHSTCLTDMPVTLHNRRLRSNPVSRLLPGSHRRPKRPCARMAHLTQIPQSRCSFFGLMTCVSDLVICSYVNGADPRRTMLIYGLIAMWLWGRGVGTSVGKAMDLQVLESMMTGLFIPESMRGCPDVFVHVDSSARRLLCCR